MMKNNLHWRKNILILLFIAALLILNSSLSLAYPMPTAIIGELSGPGADHAYVYVTAFDLDDGSILYYSSYQADELGRFIDVFSLDEGEEFKLTVQLLSNIGGSEVVSLSYDLFSGEEIFIEYSFPDLTEEDSEPDSIEEGSSGGGSGSSGNTVGRVIEVPDVEEIKERDTSGSPLNEDQERELQELIEEESNERIVEDIEEEVKTSSRIFNQIQTFFDIFLGPIKDSDSVAIMLLSSMLMVFITILVLLVLPEREKSDVEEIKKAEEEAKKPISERNLKLKGEGNFIGNLDSEKKVNDLKENEFEFIGKRKQ